MAKRIQNISKELRAKVLVIGHNRVGKTTIIKQLNTMAKEAFDGWPKADKKRGGVSLTTDSFKFTEATLSDMPNLRRLVIGTADAFIVVYDVDEDESFAYVTTLIKDIQEVKGSDVPLIVVSNKSDIDTPIQKRIIADCILTIDYGCEHLEINALNGKNMQNVFSFLLNNFGQYIVFPESNEDSGRNNSNNNDVNQDRTLKKKLGTLFRRFLCIPSH